MFESPRGRHDLSHGRFAGANASDGAAKGRRRAVAHCSSQAGVVGFTAGSPAHGRALDIPGFVPVGLEPADGLIH